VPLNEGRRDVLSKNGRRRYRFWSEGVGLFELSDCLDFVSNDDLRRRNDNAAGGCVYSAAAALFKDPLSDFDLFNPTVLFFQLLLLFCMIPSLAPCSMIYY
jgi:hypothetical protein